MSSNSYSVSNVSTEHSSRFNAVIEHSSGPNIVIEHSSGPNTIPFDSQSIPNLLPLDPLLDPNLLPPLDPNDEIILPPELDTDPEQIPTIDYAPMSLCNDGLDEKIIPLDLSKDHNPFEPLKDPELSSERGPNQLNSSNIIINSNDQTKGDYNIKNGVKSNLDSFNYESTRACLLNNEDKLKYNSQTSIKSNNGAKLVTPPLLDNKVNARSMISSDTKPMVSSDIKPMISSDTKPMTKNIIDNTRLSHSCGLTSEQNISYLDINIPRQTLSTSKNITIPTNHAKSNVTIVPAKSNVTIVPAKSNVTIVPAKSNVTIVPAKSNTPINPVVSSITMAPAVSDTPITISTASDSAQQLKFIPDQRYYSQAPELAPDQNPYRHSTGVYHVRYGTDGSWENKRLYFNRCNICRAPAYDPFELLNCWDSHSKAYECYYYPCRKTFDTINEVEQHFEKDHKPLGHMPTYYCHVCGEVVEKKENLEEHKLRHEIDRRSIKIYGSCYPCGERFLSIEECNHHIATHRKLHIIPDQDIPLSALPDSIASMIRNEQRGLFQSMDNWSTPLNMHTSTYTPIINASAPTPITNTSMTMMNKSVAMTNPSIAMTNTPMAMTNTPTPIHKSSSPKLTPTPKQPSPSVSTAKQPSTSASKQPSTSASKSPDSANNSTSKFNSLTINTDIDQDCEFYTEQESCQDKEQDVKKIIVKDVKQSTAKDIRWDIKQDTSKDIKQDKKDFDKLKNILPILQQDPLLDNDLDSDGVNSKKPNKKSVAKKEIKLNKNGKPRKGEPGIFVCKICGKVMARQSAVVKHVEGMDLKCPKNEDKIKECESVEEAELLGENIKLMRKRKRKMN